MDFFELIWEILNESDRAEKFDKFAKFYARFKAGEWASFSRYSPVKSLEKPCYTDFAKVVSMRDINKKIPSELKERNFLHNVAHIEFSAIDIALDAAYRFDDLPREYYADWLEVAEDEIRHFLMIEDLLVKKGGKYGEFEVHDGLFIALAKTQHSLLERMALLPRYMEANGLDANAHIIKKLSAQNADPAVIGALNIILEEEVSHVSKGDRWFAYACEQEGRSKDEYIAIVQALYPNSFASARDLNETHRIRAGFSAEEIAKIRALARR